MKHHSEIRQLLIGNAIRLVSEGGFEKATTKELAHCNGTLPDLKMNEAYIYRIFGSKEELFRSAFISLDDELIYSFSIATEMIGGFETCSKEKLLKFFEMTWKFIMHNEEKCRYYVRFYYSVYFKGTALLSHRTHMAGIISELSCLFKEEADVHSILHSVFTTILDFAIRVYNGELEDSDINRPHIFNVLYCMMSTYFKTEDLASNS